MRRADVVAQRVRGLVDNFDRYVDAYDSTVPFVPKQLAAHQDTVAIRRAAGSVADAVSDPRFAPSLRRTLITWQLGRRGSRLVDEADFADALRKALPSITALQSLLIDADNLPPAVGHQLWTLISDLGVVDNNSKIVAGTKTLHHLLPDLVPPMDREWTGEFFGLHAPEWQGASQRNTFLRMFHDFATIARATRPEKYVNASGWRTSRTKILDNALIGFCKLELRHIEPEAIRGSRIAFRVPGYPPAKSEALSMLGASHSHTGRVRLLLESASEALQSNPAFVPVADAPVGLELVLHPGPEQDPWDATNYLGGVADVLEDKSRRGTAVSHLGDLAQVWLYHNDRQIRQVSYREQRDGFTGYEVTISVLGL